MTMINRKFNGWMALIMTGFCLNSLALMNVCASDLTQGKGTNDERDDLDIMFMHYRSILNNSMTQQAKKEALFAMGEYFYLSSDYFEAKKHFYDYLRNSPDTSGRIFAEAYLFKMAQFRNDQVAIDHIKSNILTNQPQSYIFRDQKTYEFHSPLKRVHSAVYSIDELKIYIDDEIFVKISLS